MKRGKDICKELKAVRRQIAEENDIVLEIPECTYQGPCKGTCPRCESEVRYLENELAKRIKLGKVAKVAGLALTLAVSNGAKAQSVTPTPDSSLAEGTAGAEQQTGVCEVTGVVVDGRNQEPVPFAGVKLYLDTTKAQVVATDFDGRFRFSVPAGHYMLEVKSVGFNAFRKEVDIKGTTSDHGIIIMTNTCTKVDTIGLESQMMGLVEVTFETEGKLLDKKTKEELPFANVLVFKKGVRVNGTTSDFGGNFKLLLEEGAYEFEVSAIGYEKMRFPVKVPGDLPLKAIELESTGIPLDVMGMIEDTVPLIDPTTGGVQTGGEVNGVRVRVQY